VRASPLATLLALGAIALPSLPAIPGLPDFDWPPHLPVWAERLLYNPRERTERARGAYERKDNGAATRNADTALRLAPGDPLAQFNDGTAHLAAHHGRKAVETLDKATRAAGSELAPAAFYNLGNARLAAGDVDGAIAAYRETLLRDPARRDAKHNLELALRRQHQNPTPAPGGRPGQMGRNNNPNQPGQSKSPGGQQGNPTQANTGAPKPGEGPPAPQGSPGPSQRAAAGGDRLRGFRDQPDMSSGEAKALLAAVENLERQERRQQAAQRAKARAAQGKDW
jgi:tetratricopeptide (TPR) repeat protein